MTRPPVWPFVLAGLLLAGLLLYLSDRYRIQAMPERPLLPVTFDHADHRETACADCHHNFVDDTGGGPCYNCHKHTPEIAPAIETMFHEFCFECHVETRRKGEDSGPMRECGGCHPR